MFLAESGMFWRKIFCKRLFRLFRYILLVGFGRRLISFGRLLPRVRSGACLKSIGILRVEVAGIPLKTEFGKTDF